MNFRHQLCQHQNFVLAAAYLVLAAAITLYARLRLPYSVYYSNRNVNELYNNLLKINAQRGHDAHGRIQSTNFSELFSRLGSTRQPEFCFVVVSIRRHKQETLYLTQVVARLAPQVLKRHLWFITRKEVRT